jgi:hypothetical protein
MLSALFEIAILIFPIETFVEKILQSPADLITLFNPHFDQQTLNKVIRLIFPGSHTLARVRDARQQSERLAHALQARAKCESRQQAMLPSTRQRRAPAIRHSESGIRHLKTHHLTTSPVDQFLYLQINRNIRFFA